MLKPADIEWAVRNLLPEGWRIEDSLNDGDDLVVVVRSGREPARRVILPNRLLFTSSPAELFDRLVDLVEAALGIGRYATTPIIPVNPSWSPYP